jgi:ribonucleoside-diphosphate reductase alpha chain
VFVTCDESGCCLDGFADVFATALSMLWQYGASLEETYRKFAHQEFEPKGRTDNPEARLARSLVDYVMQVVKGETEKRSLGPKRPVIWEEVIGSGR